MTRVYLAAAKAFVPDRREYHRYVLMPMDSRTRSSLTPARQLVRRQFADGGCRRMAGQRLGVADIDQPGHQLQRVDELWRPASRPP